MLALELFLLALSCPPLARDWAVSGRVVLGYHEGVDANLTEVGYDFLGVSFLGVGDEVFGARLGVVVSAYFEFLVGVVTKLSVLSMEGGMEVGHKPAGCR